MKSKPFRLLLAAILFVIPALSANAAVDSTLRLDVKCLYQLKDYTRGDRLIRTVKTIRIDSKQLLVLLSRQAGVKYVGGSQLEVATNGQVYVTDYKENRLGNVSRYFRATLDTESRLSNGSRNFKNGQEVSRNTYPVTFTIDLPELKGTLSGVANELFKVTTPTQDGVQIATGETIAAVSGKGSVTGALSYYDGKLTLSGRKAAINK